MISKKISITIPAYNEQETIEQVSRNALYFLSLLTCNFELLLVNDGSTDNTPEIMNKLKKEFKNEINIINHKRNKGFSGAMKTCYKNAQGDFIFLGPADGQFDYSELKLFVDKIKDKDIIVAYRIVNEEGLSRKFYSFCFHLISKFLFGIRLKEFSSCMLYTKKVRDSITINANPFSCLFLPEFIYKAIRRKYRIGQVPIHFYKRKGGRQNGTNFRMIIKTLLEMGRFWIDIKLGKIR